VVVLDETWIVMGTAGIGGHARARLHGGKRLEIRCALEENGIVIESVDVDASAPAREVRKMQDGDTEKNVIDRAGDVPIELAIEIARFALPLAELATLRAGEVLVTGRAVGERVILRAGERAVAEGELVDVDGEVGVRVLSLKS
jgi:type III secretion protein Q